MVLICLIFHIYDAEHYLGLTLATSSQGCVQKPLPVLEPWTQDGTVPPAVGVGRAS